MPHPNDIMVMDAICSVLNDMFTKVFLDCSHMFKRGHGVPTFFSAVKSWGRLEAAISADVVCFFENILHVRLIEALEQSIVDPLLSGLIHNFPIIDIFDREGRNNTFNSKGIPRGSPMSSILMNIFLHKGFDKEMMQLQEQHFTSFHYLRYVDDIFIGIKPKCLVSPDHIVSYIQEWMSRIGLALKAETFGRGQ
ncbi:hypothetical protein SUGI_0597850 [Cryptomeria japonica]|nr:hypothetical protein SUGI_0597850 [Cryptomeria japonica]